MTSPKPRALPTLGSMKDWVRDVRSNHTFTHADVQGVVITAEAVYESLFGQRLFSNDPIWLAVGDRFCSGGTGNNLGKLYSVGFSSKAKTGALYEISVRVCNHCVCGTHVEFGICGAIGVQ